MARGSFPQCLLFAEDLITYFMNLKQIEWTPGTDGKVFRFEHPRRFTGRMGYFADYFAGLVYAEGHWKIATFTICDSPQDFLCRCGQVATRAVDAFRRGEYWTVDGIVLSVATTLYFENETFIRIGGWDTLTNYAERTRVEEQRPVDAPRNGSQHPSQTPNERQQYQYAVNRINNGYVGSKRR